MNNDIISRLLKDVHNSISDNEGYTEEILVIAEQLDNLDTITGSISYEVSLAHKVGSLLDLISSNGFLNKNQQLIDTLNKIKTIEGSKLRTMDRGRFRGLYVIIDPDIARGRDPFLIAQKAVQGGAKILQLRDKQSDKGIILDLAYRLQELCETSDTCLIINDHADIAKAVGSFGLHVGQTDLSVQASRSTLNISQHIGRSNRELDQLSDSENMDIDHVAFGPMFSTNTKQIEREPQGIDRLKQAREIATKPLVAIGGINIDNIDEVIDCGPEAICVTGAIGLAENPEQTAMILSRRMGY